MPQELQFRPLLASEIDVRVGNVAKTGGGFFLLLYKNARVDQCILDETFGAWNWQCKYYQVKNTMVCSVGVYNEDRHEWIWKDNGGDDDFQAEQVKAELSDSFKRACFNWGIGRELYYSPKIWVNADADNTTNARYSVKVIEYDSKKHITKLVIINDKTKQVVFSYGIKENASQTGEKAPKNPIPSENEPKGSIDKADLDQIREFIAAMHDSTAQNKVYVWLDKNFGTMNPEVLTKSQGKLVVAKLIGGRK